MEHQQQALLKFSLDLQLGLYWVLIYIYFIGDSFIHLIPEAFNTDEEGHHHRRILEEDNLLGNDSDDSEVHEEDEVLSTII